MSDSDSDVPELVPSSDEEEVKVIKTNAECVEIWLSKSVKFLEKQEQNVKIFSLGPFLMGLESFVSTPWFFGLYDSKLLNEKKYKDKSNYTNLSDEEWQNLDILDVVTKLVIKKMRKKKFLVNTLDMVDKIEEFNRGDGIDVKHSIQNATRYAHIHESVWEKALSLPALNSKVQKVKYATLYVCKLCHMMITHLAREGKDIAEDFKKTLRTNEGIDKCSKFKDQGNQQYSQNNWTEAVKLYTSAIKSDPFNHLCYGNRNQAYQKLKKHSEALADGRRALLMKPDWIKGYYRYSQSFYHTGKLDMAIAINKKGIKICEKSKNNDKMLSELKDQGIRLQQEKDGVTTDEVIQQIMSNETYGCRKEDIPAEIRDVPGCTRVIHLETAINQWSHKRHNQDASVLLSSDEQDSSEDENPISYQEAKKRVSEINKKQIKDPEVEKLTLAKNQKKKQQPNKSTDQQKKSTPSQPPVMEPKQKEKVQVTQKNENVEIERFMGEGSSAYLNGLGKKAVTSYQKALDLLAGHKPEKYGMDEQDVAVLEYAYGMAEISTGIYKHILDGIERLRNITETRKDSRLAVPYLGLGKAYILLNRFEEAVDPLNRCLRMASTLKLNELTWPGTDTKMEESRTNVLQKQVKEYLTLTKYPPPPDAICKKHTDKEDSRTVIFFSDPDFKGFVRIVCLTDCAIEFHNQCWKDFKGTFGDKICDKDILEKPCPTPDCKSCIVKIIIFRQDSMPKEISLEKTEQAQPKVKKPALKIPPSSQEKIDKRKQKKELRKQRKREVKEETDDLMDDIESAAKVSKEQKSTLFNDVGVPDDIEINAVPAPVADIAVVKKTEEQKVSKKAAKKKNKKKKDKAKQVLNVEVNFGDDTEKQLLGEDSVMDEESEPVVSSVPIVTDMCSRQEDLKKVYTQKAEMTQSHYDEISKNLFSFFEDLLMAHGPLHISDAKITTMIEDFPPDARSKIDAAGGLSNFLLQSTKFAMYGEIVSRTEDAHKASKISRQQSESFASKASKLKTNNEVKQPVSQKGENPWINKNSMKVSDKDVKSQESVAKAIPDLNNSSVEQINGDSLSANKKFKTSCMDTLDDFDFSDIPYDKTVNTKKKVVEKLQENVKTSVGKSNEYPKIPSNEKLEKTTERPVSMDMDAIDDIDLIPVTRKSKKSKKKNKGMDNLDDFDWNISDSDNYRETVGISDLESVSSREDTSYKIVGKEKMDLNKLENKLDKLDPMSELSISRSSSKSDISERSDLSAELKTMMKQKLLDSKQLPNSKSMWPTRERSINSSPSSFGPIGSPVPSDKSESKSESSETLLPYSSYSNDKNGSLMLMDTQRAAEREQFRIDSQYVQELTDQVMKDMTLGRNLTEAERNDLQKQVSQDIWNDFKRTSKKSKKLTTKSNDIGYEYTTNKQSYTELYMKNFYQKKNTDPTLNPESFSVVTCANMFYGDSAFSNSSLSSNSGWPKSVSESLAYPGFQSTFTPSQSLFSSVTSSFSAFGPNTTSISSFSSFGPNTTSISSFSSFGPPKSTFPSVISTASSFSSLAPGSSSFAPMMTKQEYQSPFSLTNSKTDLFGTWSIGISVTQTSNNMTTTSSEPLNTFPGNYTSSVYSNPFQKFQLEKSVQAVVETCTISINTDPYEPFKEEFQRMRREHELLQLDLQNSLIHKQELASQLQEIGHRYKTIELENSIKNDAFSKERQSMQEKYDLLYLEFSHLNQKHSQAAEHEKELRSNFMKLEEQNQELIKQKSKERQELKHVEDDIKKRHEEYKSIYEKEKERAARAEIEIVNLKKQASISMLERSKKEASFHVHQIKGLHKGHQEKGKEIPAKMIQALSYYESVVKRCNETIPKVVSDFDEQITLIHGGKCLSELASVFVPPPPPPAYQASSPGPDRSLSEETTAKISSVEPSPTKPSLTSGLTPISVKGPSSQSQQLSAPPRPIAPPPGIQLQPQRHQIPRLAANLNGQNTPKNSFEKLLQRLTVSFPQYNRAIFTQLIQQLRQSRGGSLSGLTIDEITNQVTAMIQTHEQKQGKVQANTVETPRPSFPGPGPAKIAPPPGLSSTWGFIDPNSNVNKGEEVFEEEQDPCVICHEEMTPDTTVNLECQHRFHDECIRKWLKENSTCPNCRIYALLPDEFPTLV